MLAVRSHAVEVHACSITICIDDLQEMYAFSVASSQLVGGPVKYALQRELMIQPPWDEQLTAANGQDAYILHYTYGQDCDEKTGTPLTDKVSDNPLYCQICTCWLQLSASPPLQNADELKC